MVEKKRVFQYQDISSNALFERANEREERRDTFLKQGIKFYIPKEKTNKLRTLPPTWDNAKHYGFDAYIHYGIGKSNSSYLCPVKMGTDKRCPVCEEITTGVSKTDKEFVDKVKARRKVLVYVIDRDDEAAGPKLFPMPFSMDRNFVIQAVDDGTGAPIRIFNPTEGYDISFEKDGVGIKTKYSGERIARKATPLSPNPLELDKWLQFITDNPIPEIIDTKTYDYIKDVFEGRIVEEEVAVKAPVEVEQPFEPKPPVEVEEMKPPKVALSRDEKEELISDHFNLRLKEIRAMSDETIDAHIEKMRAEEQEVKTPAPEKKSGVDKLKELKEKYNK